MPASRTVVPLLAVVVWLLAAVGSSLITPSSPVTSVARPPLAAPDDLLVAFRDDVGDEERRARLAALGLQTLDIFELTGVFRVRARPGTAESALEALIASGSVRFVEWDAPLRVAQSPPPAEPITPDDPLYEDQAWFMQLMEAPAGWAITLGDRSVIVAVLDGAVDLDHPELIDSIWTNPGEVPDNGIDDDGNGYIDDVHGYDFIGDYAGPGGRIGEDSDPDAKVGDPAVGDGIDQDNDGKPDGAVGHGTQVAGIIAAAGNNGVGIAGAAWQVTIMPVRVTGPEGNGFFSSFVRALEYAVANGADVVNISLESNFLPLTVEETVQAALDAGLIMVGAAGNTGFGVSFPASLPGVIAVGSTRGEAEPDRRALFSPVSGEVEFVAPGENIPSPTVEAVTGEASFGTGTGTSFSAPLVTGAIALIRSIRPTATLSDVRAFLRAGATDLPDLESPFWDGAGRINYRQSLAAALAGPLPAPVLDTVIPGETLIVVTGRAVPNALVTLTDDASGLVITTEAAGPGGRFSIDLPLAELPETMAVLVLVATAEGDSGLSLPSLPFVLNLPRSVELFPGWNLVSWSGEAGSGAEVLAGLPGEVERVFSWSGGGWDVHAPGSAFLTIDAIETGDGLWIFMGGQSSAIWPQTRTPYQATDLRPGWQLVAWPGPTATVAESLLFTAADVQAVFGWLPLESVFLAYRTRLPGSATLESLAHLDAVWVLVGDQPGGWPGP